MDLHQFIQAKVIFILTKQTHMLAPMIAPTHRLAEDLGLDSLGKVETFMQVEDMFCISITDEVVSRIATVQGILDLVEARFLVPTAPKGQFTVMPVWDHGMDPRMFKAPAPPQAHHNT